MASPLPSRATDTKQKTTKQHVIKTLEDGRHEGEAKDWRDRSSTAARSGAEQGRGVMEKAKRWMSLFAKPNLLLVLSSHSRWCALFFFFACLLTCLTFAVASAACVRKADR